MDLSGKFLIAMPALEDPRFERSVVLICDHTPEGTLGIIINKPLPDMKFANLLDQIGIPHTDDSIQVPVHYGGPVEQGRGFVLHSSEWAGAAGTRAVTDTMAMTTTQEVLEALGRGQGPSSAILALGYAGWGAGQLESEILRNDWLTSDADIALVFDDDQAAKWTTALARMKINPLTLSGRAGHA